MIATLCAALNTLLCLIFRKGLLLTVVIEGILEFLMRRVQVVIQGLNQLAVLDHANEEHVKLVVSMLYVLERVKNLHQVQIESRKRILII